MSEPFQIRELFNEKIIKYIAHNISSTYKEFQKIQFLASLIPKYKKFSFGDRCSLIADSLHQFLPGNFPTAVKILVNSLGPEPETEEFSDYDDFYIMPECLYVSRYGLEYFEESMRALYEMTKRLSAEGDIRYFLIKYPDKTWSFLDKLTRDKSPFARRLATEGTRPRLPLGIRLPAYQKDPSPVIKLLDKLYTDPNLMVRRSVANNINDISKDNPGVVVKTLNRWNKNKSPLTKWVISHGLRTLLKQGNPGALQLMGYDPKSKFKVKPVKLKKEKLKLGESLEFSGYLVNTEKKTVNCMIDYVIYFMKANKKQAPKVFKAFKKKLKPGEVLKFEKKHVLKKMSTRTLYTGTHALELQINGKKYFKKEFHLSV